MATPLATVDRCICSHGRSFVNAWLVLPASRKRRRAGRKGGGIKRGSRSSDPAQGGCHLRL